MGHKRTIILLFVLTSFLQTWGQEFPEIKTLRNDPYARFIPFDSYLGKDHGQITDIIQDKHGYIWLAGTKGLFRFDGNNVRKYLNDWTPGSLPSSFISCLVQDNQGRLWIGTSNGLCRYNYENESFINVFDSLGNNSHPDTLYVRALMVDGDSLLWMETLQGYLWKIDLQTLTVLNQIRHAVNRQPYYYYHNIYREDDGLLWVGGRNIGPYYLDEEKQKLISVLTTYGVYYKGKKRDDDVAYFYHDSYDNFWMGALDGIYVVGKDSLYFHLFYPSSSWAMMEDSQGLLWFGIGSGLAKYNPETGEMILFQSNEEDEFAIPGDEIYSIYEDSYSQIWVATTKGVAIYKQEIPGVDYLFHIPGIDNTPASSSITSLLEDEKRNLWIATSEKGIDRFNLLTHEITHFNSNNTRGLPTNKVRTIELGTDGNIYCGLWAGIGFGKLNPITAKFELYTYRKSNTYSDWYNDLEFDDKGNLYLGFWGGPGLTIFDVESKNFGRVLTPKFQDSYMSRLITCLHFDKQGRLWIGTTRNGLHVYLPENDTSISYFSKHNPISGIDEDLIYDVAEDNSGNIWIGSNGLYLLEPGNDTIKPVIFRNYSETPEVYVVLPEHENLIWLLTNKGLLKYAHRFGSVTDYSKGIKLDFTGDEACALILKDQRLVFAGSNGIAIVDPDRLDPEVSKPGIFLSSLSVFDEIKIPGLGNVSFVELNYDENFFSIVLGSDTWGDDDPFSYYYKLDAFSKEWTEISKTDRVARFTNVPPGNYSFKIRVEDQNGNIYDDAAYCKIRIIPPFWERWWFVLLALFTGLTVIALIWWNRMRRLQLSLSNMELNQKLLRLQMNPHFIFNSLFAIQNYIYENKTHLAGNYLSDFAHLIRLILDNSRHEYISFEKELECIELYLKMQKLRFDEKFNYGIDVDPQLKNGDYAIPPMLAQPFIENAIEHGIKNLNKKGEINVKYKLANKDIQFTVTDNGIGLTASKAKKDKSEPKHESLAISICRRRLEVLRSKGGGNILFSMKEIKDEDGRVNGTMVAFNIPFRQ